ncbi:MAG TPA: helix-turn-helix domain-containing protein [Acidimicrobiia bacterium]|nr:helix-turn-helix domain-containing protein [Acidimicrobiia bacterium]
MDETREPLQHALKKIGDRWSLMIIDALLDGPRRFSDLEGAVAGIAPNTLSSRLGKLEEEGVVTVFPYSERPTRNAYELTAAGHDLAGALRLLAHWGDRLSDEGPAIRHDLCGTPLDARWYCPSCDLMTDHDAGPATHRA